MLRHSFALVGVLLAGSVGCGPAVPANAVSGKVTSGGSPVVGTIHFVGADGKEKMSPVGPTGGIYTIVDPPLGEVTVLVKGDALPASLAPATSPDMPKMPDMPLESKGGSGSVPPPKKYADASGGLKYKVEPGKQTKDFDLAP